MIAAAWRWLQARARAARAAPWRWLCLFGLVFAVGWALYVTLPPAPRWRVPGYYWLQGFAEDGRVAVVVTMVPEPQQQKPVQWRFAWVDVDSGRTLRNLDVVCAYALLSPKFNVLAAGDGKAFWFIDIATGRKTTAQGDWETLSDTTSALRFSRSGRWLIRKRDQTAYLIDTASGAIHKQWDGITDKYWYVPGNERFVLSLKDGTDERLATWDAEIDTQLAPLGPYRRWHALGQHGRYVIGSPAGDDSCFHVIDVTRKEVVLKLPAAKRSLSRFAVSQDGRQGAFWFQEQGADGALVEFWDLHDKVERSVGVVAHSINQAVFAADGKHCALIQDKHVAVVDLSTGAERWRRPNKVLAEVCFSADSSQVGILTASGSFAFFDAASGTPRQTIALFPQSDWSSAQVSGAYSPRWSDDRRYLVFCHHDVIRTLRVPLIETGIALPRADEVCVLDAKEQRVAATLRVKELAAQEFTTHGPTVLTCQEDGDGPHLTAWDVPPRKRWPWVVGGPLVLGAVLVGYSRWRRRG